MKRRLELIAGVAMLLASIASVASAQTTEEAVNTRLLGKPLYLRSQASSDKLEFDEQGKLAQTLLPASFTASGVDVTSAKISPKELVLKGYRAGIVFRDDRPSRVQLRREPMTIRIRRPTDGDFSSALDALFTDDPEKLDIPMPSYWLRFLHRLPASADSSTISPLGTHDTPLPRTNDMKLQVQAPKLLSLVEPAFSPSARAFQYSAKVVVNCIVAVDGTTTNLNVLHPAGLGLDESAIKAVSQYKFRPAMKEGKPVPVELNVEVNFQLF